MQYDGYPTIPPPWETKALVPEGTEGETLRWEDKAKWKDTGLKINIVDYRTFRLWSLPLIPEPLGKKSLRVLLLEKLTPKKISNKYSEVGFPMHENVLLCPPYADELSGNNLQPIYTEAPVHC